MIELSLDEIKKIELRILQEVHEICQAQKLRYSLCGGTLLGAVRHKGFIPWDDDIDIFMPRPDYIKFIHYCKNHETSFRLISHETEDNYGYLFAKAASKRTLMIEENMNSQDIKLGVNIDIFPIDGLGNTYREAKANFSATKLQRELLVAANWKRFMKSKTHCWYYEPIRFVFFVLSRFIFFDKLIPNIQEKYLSMSFDLSSYAGVVCGAYRLKEILEQSVYTEFIDLSFEKMTFKAIKKYDVYLSSIYGDYMKLPPKKNQISHHIFKAYSKEDGWV